MFSADRNRKPCKLECIIEMIETFMTPIPKLGGRKPRKVYVYLPDAVQEDPAARYPVLYMFDGHNVFFDEEATYGKSWGMKDYMDATATPLIIVAVDCNHGPNHARLKEYAPFSFENEAFGTIRGRGKATMEWFAHTLKPMIDARYPTLPEREATFIAGSSMGGLMSLYAVLAYNDVYARAACLSPSIWVAPEKMQRLIRDADLSPDTVIYMDYGAREFANHEGMCRCFADVTSQLMEKQVCVTSRIVPNGDHCEACWEEQIPFFINTLFYARE